jgi:hypothetical protein
VKAISSTVSIVFVLAASAAFAVFALSGSFGLYKPTLGSGGTTAASISYRQSSLLSQTAVGTTGSAGYVMHHGFWGGPGTSVTAVDGDAEDLPRAFGLDDAYPNPFNPATRIRFELPEPARARLLIYNLKGQLVRTLLDETRPPGRYEVLWNGRDDDGSIVASGTYLLRMRAGGFVAQRKLTLLK